MAIELKVRDFPTRRQQKLVNEMIPVSEINVLPQPRITFKEIPQLADSLAVDGLFNPLLVACLDDKHIDKYLTYIAKVWNIQQPFKNIQSSHTGRYEGNYFILIAGERRFRAIKHLLTNGCSNCQEQYGPGNCYSRHFDSDEDVEVRLAINIDPRTALRRQAAENIHQRVPEHEEAAHYTRLLRVEREANPKLPLIKFARSVGRTPEAIKAALKYVDLPDHVQNLVEKGILKFNKAVALTKLIDELQPDETELRWWVDRACFERMNLDQFREKIEGHIRDKKCGQTMMDIFSAAQEEAMRKAYIKKTAAKEHVMAWNTGAKYLRIIRTLIESGEIPNIYSINSPRKAVRQILNELGLDIRQLAMILPETATNEAKDIVNDGERLLL